MPDYGLGGLALFSLAMGNDFVLANPAYPQRVDVARHDLASNRFRSLSHYSSLEKGLMRTIRFESPHVPPVISTSSRASDVISMHFANVRRVLAEVQMHAVERLVEIFREARDRGSFIYIAGNGGSSSTASHWVNDLGKATKRSGCRPLKVMCLSDNMSWFSALSNDEGYERAFSGQLENFATPGDVLTCISASGNSPNLVRAVDLARRLKLTTVALLGFDGGVLKGLVDESVCVETEKGRYELVEDVHSAICHAVIQCLVADRPGPN